MMKPRGQKINLQLGDIAKMIRIGIEHRGETQRDGVIDVLVYSLAPHKGSDCRLHLMSKCHNVSFSVAPECEYAILVIWFEETCSGVPG